MSVRIPVLFAFALATACNYQPSVDFSAMKYPDLALGETTQISVTIDPPGDAPRLFAEDPTVLRVGEVVAGASEGAWLVTIEAVGEGQTALVADIDGDTFSRNIGVAAATGVGLWPSDGDEDGARVWPETVKVMTLRFFFVEPVLRSADGRPLTSSAEFSLSAEPDAIQFLPLTGELEHTIIRVVLDATGPTEVDLITTAPVPPAHLTLIGMDVFDLVNIDVTREDELPASAGRERCLSAVGIDAEGDEVLGVDVEWTFTSLLGSGDRFCYTAQDDLPREIRAGIAGGEGSVSTTIHGRGFEVRRSGLGECQGLFCL